MGCWQGRESREIHNERGVKFNRGRVQARSHKSHKAMLVEKYYKTVGGKPYFSVYFRFGKVEVAISDIQAADKEKAKVLAKEYLVKSIEQL